MAVMRFVIQDSNWSQALYRYIFFIVSGYENCIWWYWAIIGQQGYWMVKRAVGTKACLLGKAVTCHYFRQDNFLEVIHFYFHVLERSRCLRLGKKWTILDKTRPLLLAREKVWLKSTLLTHNMSKVWYIYHWLCIRNKWLNSLNTWCG